MLNDKWRAFHKSSILIHRCPLYLIASTAGSLYLLTQFISSQGLPLLLDISWIFWLKKDCLEFLTVLLNCFQFSMHLVDLYFSRSYLQFSSYQLLECLVMLMTFEFSFHILSIDWARKRTPFSSDSILDKLLVSIEPKVLMILLIKALSSSLSLTINCFLVWICSLTIGIVIVNEVGSDVSHHFGWIEWLLISFEPNHRNIKSMTKFKSWLLSKYLVGTWLVGLDRPKLKESAISNNKSL